MELPSIGCSDPAGVEKLALQLGYRFFDLDPISFPLVASNIIRSGIRDQVYLSLRVHEPPSPDQLLQFLRDTGVGYLNILIVDCPSEVGKLRPSLLRRLWHKMDALRLDNRVRSLGLNNASLSDLQTIMAYAANDKLSLPCLVRKEVSPTSSQYDLSSYCRLHKISLFSPVPVGIECPQIKEIAKTLGCHPDQVLMAALLRRGIGILPSSRTNEIDLQNVLAVVPYIQRMTPEMITTIFP